MRLYKMIQTQRKSNGHVKARSCLCHRLLPTMFSRVVMFKYNLSKQSRESERRVLPRTFVNGRTHDGQYCSFEIDLSVVTWISQANKVDDCYIKKTA